MDSFGSNATPMGGAAGRCDALRANVALCGADVTVHQGDYNALYDTLRQDIVFLDVPWGGPEYVEAEGAAAVVPREQLMQRL